MSLSNVPSIEVILQCTYACNDLGQFLRVLSSYLSYCYDSLTSLMKPHDSIQIIPFWQNIQTCAHPRHQETDEVLALLVMIILIPYLRPPGFSIVFTFPLFYLISILCENISIL